VPTAIATAAPVPYLVQSGDTLVDIAAANDVTLNELLALNPDVQPELLMVGQQLFLPPLPTDEAPAILVTSQAIAIEISGPSTYSSVGGGVWVLGEVQNTGGHAVELIQVEVTLLDQDEVILAEETVWVTPLTLQAGGKAPFGLLFPSFDGAKTVVRTSIAAGRPVHELGSRYLDLAVSGAEVTIGRNPIEVEGQLDNVGGQTAGQISIITTFYDDQGTVTGFHEKRLEGALAPGESMPFQFVALPPGGRAHAYAFATQAVIFE
jgi:LysM repeat protein